MMISQKELKQILDYNQDTGIFAWTHFGCKNLTNQKAGHLNKSGYISIRFKDKLYYAHRLAWVYIYGSIDANLQIDHINHVRHDNSINNIRLVEKIDNYKNLSLRSNNKSGIQGVAFDKIRNKWAANIKINYKKIFLGRFKDKQDAIISRKQAEIKYGFHENHGSSE